MSTATKTPFTPGPWEAVEIEEGLFHIHSPKGDRHNPVPVAILDHHRDGHEGTRTVTTPANARLIAAAPDIHSALKEAKEFIENLQLPDAEWSRVLDVCVAALAKAEGKQP